jgi:hypothetical protein
MRGQPKNCPRFASLLMQWVSGFTSPTQKLTEGVKNTALQNGAMQDAVKQKIQ